MSDDFDFSDMSDDELWDLLPDVPDFEKGQIYFHLHHRYSKKSEHKTALSVATKAEAIYLELDICREIGIAKMLKGRSNLALKKYETAIECLTESKEVLLTTNLDGDRAHCYYLIGNAYFDQKEFSKAAENYQDAITMYEAIDEACAVTSICNDAGHSYYRMGNYPKSIEFFERSIAAGIEGELPHHMFNSLFDIAHVYHATGAYDMALQSAERAFALGSTCSCPKCEPKALALKGRMLRATGDIEAAIRTLNRALEIYYDCNDTKAQIPILVDLGLCYVLSNRGKAMQNFDRANTLLDLYPNLTYQRIMLNIGLGCIALMDGEFESASEFYALAYTDSQSSVRYTAERHQILPNYFDALFALGHPDQVLKILAETESGSEPWFVSQLQVQTWTAQAQLELGDSTEAIKAAQSAIDLAGLDQDKLLERATCHEVMAKALGHDSPREAKDHAQKSISYYLAIGHVSRADALNDHYVLAAENQLANAIALEDDRNTYDEFFGKVDPIVEQVENQPPAKILDNQADDAG